ncbi:MAG: hypothetical protein JWN95_1489 [Frankiales bacterium]|nr:hypothetical protein [Frankiales bacterium]
MVGPPATRAGGFAAGGALDVRAVVGGRAVVAGLVAGRDRVAAVVRAAGVLVGLGDARPVEGEVEVEGIGDAEPASPDDPDSIAGPAAPSDAAVQPELDNSKASSRAGTPRPAAARTHLPDMATGCQNPGLRWRMSMETPV